MKKSFLLAIIGALMAFSLAACEGSTPQASGPNNDDNNNEQEQIDNTGLDETASYTLRVISGSSISMGHNDSAQVLLELVNADTGEAVADAGLYLTLDMSVSKSASFSRSSNNKTSLGVYTEYDGVASATIYSAAKNATGKFTASLPDHDCNSVEITISINDEGGDNPGNEEGTTGNVFVTLNNSESQVADSAELFIKEIENSSYASSLCEDFLSGIGINNEDAFYSMNRIGSSGTHTFRNLTAGKKVVVWAVGYSGNNEVAKACAESASAVSASAPIDVELTFKDLPPNLDHDYDVMLGIDLVNIMPTSWRTWFDLIDNIFTTPVGTAIYYALWAWEYKGGGASLNLGVTTVDFWDDVTGDMELGALLDACGIPNGEPGANCPSLLTFKLFPLAVNAAEDALDEIDGFGDIYASIKTVGNNILSMAKKFDIGARFNLSMTDEDTLSVTETWTHVVWTWQLNDTSPECTKGSDTYNAATCGRHAFDFSKSGSVVNETYDADFAANTNDGYTVTLPNEHAFLLRYGALLKILIDDVVVPQIMLNDKDQLNTDGDDVVVNGDESLGDLLNYWIPCTKFTTWLHNWLSGLNTVGPLIGGFLSQSTLDGYCELGLNAAGDFAMDKLAELVVDANIKVRAGSSFELNELDGDRAPTVLENLDYDIGLTVEEVNEEGHVTGEKTYDAHLTGEGIFAVDPQTPEHCAEFLSLSYERAEAACGN